jgi:hypothetical protein
VIIMSYKPGDYKVICDRCGFERFASDCRLTWDGWFVCGDTCWEAKHEQFTPPKPLGEKQSVPIRRAEDVYNFVKEGATAPEDGYFITSETYISGDDLISNGAE